MTWGSVQLRMGWLAMALAAAGLLAAPAPTARSASPAKAAYCRLSIDVGGRPDAHRQLLQHTGLITCPFETGPHAVATAFAGVVGATTCPTAALGDLPVIRAEALPGPAFASGLSCNPSMSRTLLGDEPSQGAVWVLERQEPDGAARPTVALFSAVSGALWRSGLPFAFVESFGAGGADGRQHEFACFETLSPTDADPVTLLTGVGVALPPGVTQTRSSQPNCFSALKAMGYPMPVRVSPRLTAR